MAFSKEDRKQVYDFFEKLLLVIDRPVFYEHLRGHVGKADSVVRAYVTKECKGENLLKYFKTRKNYFEVSLKGEVSLKKSRCRLLSYKSEIEETEEVNNDENSINDEICEDSEYSYVSNYPRCYSTASDNTEGWESFDEYTLSRNKLADKERSDYEEVTHKYFSRYLSRKGRVIIDHIEIEDLPKKVKRYLKNYMRNKLLLFFKNNSECYHVDDDKYVSLISPIMENVSQKEVKYDEDSPLNFEMSEESFDISEAEAQTVENFLSCVEFFLGILRKKNSVTLKNLSGSLSQAPSSVLIYLKSNYENYKNFLLSVSCLFIINEKEEVSLTKDCYTLFKRAKKLFRLKSNVEFWSQPIESIICSLFKTEVHAKIRNSSLGDERHCSVSEQLSENPDINSSNEDSVCLTGAIDSEYKIISSVHEKWKTTDSEDFEVESFNNCGNVTRVIYPDVSLQTSVHETPLKVDNTAASDKENCKTKADNELSRSSGDSVTDINNTNEALFGNTALEPNVVLQESVSSVQDAFLQNSEILNNNPCILSNEIIKKQTSKDFIECAFTAQLLCLEIVEREKILTLNFEYEAVKYFVEILESSIFLYDVGKSLDLNALKGKIGQASVGVRLFLKQFYKGEKIISFFQKYHEFLLDLHTSWIELSPHYKKSLESRRIENENFNNGVKLYHVHSLYNYCFHDIVAEVFDCLSKICCFLQNKPKVRFIRLCGIFSKFTTIQQNFINSLSGSEVTKKFENFLLYFKRLFHFDDIYIEINPEIDIPFLVNSVTEFNEQLKSSAESKLPYFHHLSEFIESENVSLDFEELRKITIKCVQDFFSYASCFNYSDLPNIVEHEVLHSLILEGKDSQYLIKLIEDCDLFELKNGQIFLKKDTSEQIIDNQDELSNSFLDRSDTNTSDDTFHKASTEIEQFREVCSGLNKNESSLYQNTDIIESNNQSFCTDNMEVENSLKDYKNPKLCSESALSDCETKIVEESISIPEVGFIHEEKGDKEVITRTSSSAFPKDSYYLDSDLAVNNDSLSCITKATDLNIEKDVEGNALSHGINSGLQVLDGVEIENGNNSDKRVKEGKIDIESDENLTISSLQSLIVAASSKEPNKSCVDNFQTSMKVEPAEKKNSEENILAKPFNDNIEKNKHDETQHCNLKSKLSPTSPTSLSFEPNEGINEEPDILKLNHAVESNTHESIKLNQKLGVTKPETFLIKTSHAIEAKEESELVSVESSSVLEDTANKFISENNLPSEESQTKLIDLESKKMCDDRLSFSYSVKKYSEVSASIGSYESVVNTTALSDSNRSQVDCGDSLNSQKSLHIDTVKISTKQDEKSVEIAKDAHFITNDEFENDKDIFKDKKVEKSFYANDSDACKNDENVTKFRKEDEIHTDNENHFKLNKRRENFSDNSPRQTRLENNESGVIKGNFQQAEDSITRNKNPSLLIAPQCTEFDHTLSVLTTDDKCVPEESIVESKPNLTNFKSSDVSMVGLHNQAEFEGALSNSLSSSNKLPEFIGVKQNVKEKSDLLSQNFNLQPLQCKIILLTVDSCIGETVINGCKKFVFCLKSSFFCDEHTDCLCFDSLSVGDSVQCYIPPGTGFNRGNMCISFMICRDSDASTVESEFSSKNKGLQLDNNKSPLKEGNQQVSSTVPNYLSLKQIHIPHKMSESQTEISGEIKRCSSVAEKGCIAKSSTVSQGAQTIKCTERKHKSCQTQILKAIQSTQTIYKSTENECQTVYSGEIKPCSFTEEKACQMKCTVNSVGTQNARKCVTNESQTDNYDLTTPALTSSECNTDLSGPVRRYVQLANKSLQVSSNSTLVCQTTQTVSDNTTALKSTIHLFRDQQLYANAQNVSAQNKSEVAAERAGQRCDAACQTVSTGAIMIKKYFM